MLALMLALAMVFSLTACGGSSDSGTTSGGSSSSEGSSSDTSGADAETSESTYTYSYSTSAPSTWSPTDWQNSVESDIQSYTMVYFYSFVMNDDKDGYDIVCEAASAMPVDVTADYAGNETYGIPADATEGYAWTITLNEAMCWEDGTPITADDYIYTLQQYLNPEMKNYRASSFYEGTVGLANAYNYYNSDKSIGYTTTLADLGYSTVEEAEADGYTNFGVDIYNFWGIISDEGDTVVDITDETLIRDEAVEEGEDGDYISAAEVYDYMVNYYADYIPDYVYVGEALEAATWDEVGVIKNDDYSLTFILTNPTTQFYVCYSMEIGLVYEELYEACKTQTGDIVKSSYGTSADTYMSYGPYKIVSYQADKEMKLTKNENWYGYTDGEHEGQYITTDIYVQYIDEPATELSLFLQGNLDEYGVGTTDMETYANSDYIYYMPTTYAYVFTFNTDEESLKSEDADGVNHSILSIKDFREAISLSLDRQSFATQCLAGSDAGYGLIDYVYVCDPDTGELYRNSEYAIQALCELYGVTEESQITGYDKDAAAALFESAYAQAIESGLMSEGDRIELDYHVYADTENNQNRVNFLQSSIDAATVGTSLEGKVTINLLVDEDYYNNCMAGMCDIAFTAWGGEDMSPYAMMQCYTDSTYNLVYGYDGESEMITITVNGEELTMSAYDWYKELVEGTYATADSDTRNQILAGMEKGILEYYGMAPLAYLNEAVMYSQRIVLGSDTYVNSLVGFGGLRMMTYTMDDDEWAEYCASQNNQLTY